jgi:uncharacterized membrane protein (UPF0127 family)
LIGNNKQVTTQQNSTSQTTTNQTQQTADSDYVEIVTGPDKYVDVNVEIADTQDERRAGLSFRKYLGDYNGMLFMYDAPVNDPYTMNNMQIPIDMIFIDSQYFIVDIKENLTPCTSTYCPDVYSNSSYQYVLEVNAGFCKNNNVAKGGSLVLHLKSD